MRKTLKTFNVTFAFWNELIFFFQLVSLYWLLELYMKCEYINILTVKGILWLA